MNRVTTRVCATRLAVLVLLALLPSPSRSQGNIPIGTWRLHLSYRYIKAVEIAPDRVFAAGTSGIVVYDRQEKRLSTYDKLTGLSNTGISCIRYAANRNMLLVGYEDGGLDIITPSTIYSFSRLKDAEVTSAKKINDISVHGDIAYLSTAYGVVLFDLEKLEIKETWRDLGAAGDELHVYRTAFLGDSIYLATRNGVLAGNLADNLLDFVSWERFNTDDLSGSVRAIATFAGKVYAAGTTGVFRLGDNAWIAEPLLSFGSLTSLTASEENLFLVSDSTIRAMNRDGAVSQVADPLLRNPLFVRQDELGNLWVGDASAGLASNSQGSWSSYIPNGPSRPMVSRMVSAEGKLFAVSGGYSASGEPRGVPGEINVFTNGTWTTETLPFPDLTDVAFFSGARYVSSFGSGIEKRDGGGSSTILNQTNSPLINTDPQRSTVTALTPSPAGLWIANWGGTEPLHLLKSDGTWQSFTFGFPNEQRPVAMTVDPAGDVWMALDPQTGGGLIAFDPESGRAYYRTAGKLPHTSVRCVASDKQGYTWVGTDAGVAYFYSPTEDAIQPIYEGRFLLRDEKVTAIEVDGGNRKWIGTQQGVWLFNPDGETLLQHFTPDNSPLPSGRITDIEILDETGEVFFATDRGIASYQSDAVEPDDRMQEVKIFPNPIPPGYSGTVGISGLVDNAVVRITDISGKLIWRTRANGGMATWNGRDQNGRPAATGVYLVFASSEDGRENAVGKIAVIE